MAHAGLFSQTSHMLVTALMLWWWLMLAWWPQRTDDWIRRSSREQTLEGEIWGRRQGD